MIEINLLPDVKQEFVKARKIRSTVVSVAILIGIIASAVVVLLALYVFGAQTLRDDAANKRISSESAKLTGVEDINNTLTIQNQLTQIASLHDEKNMSSRLFSILTAINPPAPNNATLSKLVLDSELGTVSVEGFTGGYPQFETFRKTLQATTLSYRVDGENEAKTVKLASDLVEGERSFGDDETNNKVLRFTLSFTYAPELLSRSSQDARIIGPSRTNATDSFQGVPKSLLGTSSTTDREGQ